MFDSKEDSAIDEAVIQGWRERNGSRLWRITTLQDAHRQNELSVQNIMGTVQAVMADDTQEFMCEELMVKNLTGNVYDLPSVVSTVRYLHAALGFPTKSSLLKAVRKGYLATFPGLAVNAINKYFPESDETQKGHMKQVQQGIRSTKTKQQADDEDNNGRNEEDVY